VSLPKVIGDNVVFDRKVASYDAQPLVTNETLETVVGILVRAGPNNLQPIYVGDATRQVFPLAADQSIALPLSRRSVIYVKGTPPDEVLFVAVLATGELQPVGGAKTPPRPTPGGAKGPDYCPWDV
jgi:hypothetical protein